MRRIVPTSYLLMLVILIFSLSGCSTMNSLFPDRSKEYKQAKTSASLEVPPDLTQTPVSDALAGTEGAATLSGYTSARQVPGAAGAAAVLPTPEGIRLERDGDRSWLVVDGDPEAVWPRARDFWLESDYLLVREDPATAVLETDWVDSRANVPQGIIRSTISRVFANAYSSAYRDRYRMRMERGETPGTVDIFITHQGIQEIWQGSPDTVQTTTWEPRPIDPGLESEMLKELMIWLGVEPQRAADMTAAADGSITPRRAELVPQASGQAQLVVYEEFSSAWRSVGITLDRIDFAVEDRNRTAGIYYVRYNDPLKDQRKGVMSKLAFWSKDDGEGVETYQIKLHDDGTDTRVEVMDAAGEPEMSDTAVRILKLLEEELQ